MRAPATTGAEVGPAILVSDLVQLAKPRITLMVMLTAGIGLLLASGQSPPLGLAIAVLVGTGLVAAGGSALNHHWERDTDRLMERTATRPLPAGRMHPDVALGFGTALAAAGLLLLALAVNLLSALLGLIAFAGYVFVYTPLKRVTPLATVVGAVPGAIPPMMGWAAASGRLDAGAWALFAILFLWQLPHFLAIAWICREDYARAGMPVYTVGDTGGTRTARQMVLWAAALVPVSLLPAALGLAGATYLFGALLLGLALLATCLGFLRRHSSRAARRLLLASVVYLPAVLAILVVDRLA
ncbi:MAG: heme o synthase [Thermoanaerobaculia bacterium]